MLNFVNTSNKNYNILNFRIDFYKKYLLLNYLKKKKIIFNTFLKNYLINNSKNKMYFKLKKKNKLLNIKVFKNNIKYKVFLKLNKKNLNLHKFFKKFNKLFLYVIKLKKRKFNIFINNVNKFKIKKINNLSNFAILKFNNYITNYNILLTTLQGKVLLWSNGGCLKDETKRTRMTARAVRLSYKFFLKKLKKSAKIKSMNIKYLKIQYIGPSKRFRGLIKRMTKVRRKSLKLKIFCVEEQFIDTFNGCKLIRKKR
jgi:ribosomal protein S11